MEPEARIEDWIMDPLIRQEAEALLKFDLKYKYVSIYDAGILPEAIKKGPNFDERLRAKVDIDMIIENEEAELKEKANKRIPLKKHDISKKDLALLEKVNLLS